MDAGYRPETVEQIDEGYATEARPPKQDKKRSNLPEDIVSYIQDNNIN